MTEAKKSVAYRIETTRTVIRCWSPTDARMLREAIDESDAHLRPAIPWMKDEPRSLQATVEWLRDHRGRFDLDQNYKYAIFDPSELVLIGETGLYLRQGPDAREVGYWIDRRHDGMGYASEVTAAMVRVAFELGEVDRVEIHCTIDNQTSAKIPARLGFTHEANLRRRGPDSEGVLKDMMIWTLFADQYPGSPASKTEIRAYDCIGTQIIGSSVQHGKGSK